MVLITWREQRHVASGSEVKLLADCSSGEAAGRHLMKLERERIDSPRPTVFGPRKITNQHQSKQAGRQGIASHAMNIGWRN